MKINNKFPISSLVIAAGLLCGPLGARDKTEERLADAVAKANRTVAHAQEKAQAAGAKLEAHCKGLGLRAGIRPIDGLWGCVAPLPPVPAPPPGTAR